MFTATVPRWFKMNTKFKSSSFIHECWTLKISFFSQAMQLGDTFFYGKNGQFLGMFTPGLLFYSSEKFEFVITIWMLFLFLGCQNQTYLLYTNNFVHFHHQLQYSSRWHGGVYFVTRPELYYMAFYGIKTSLSKPLIRAPFTTLEWISRKKINLPLKGVNKAYNLT